MATIEEHFKELLETIDREVRGLLGHYDDRVRAGVASIGEVSGALRAALSSPTAEGAEAFAAPVPPAPAAQVEDSVSAAVKSTTEDV